MAKEHYYEVNLKWENGRIGELSAPDLSDKITCATPPEFPQGVAGIWSPEHLYAASINSCYMTTFLAIAEASKLEFEDFSCKTTCKLEKVDGRFLISEAVIEPEVQLVNATKDAERAIRILEKTKSACLISNSMKTAVILKHRLAVEV